MILSGVAATKDNLKGYHDNWLKAMGNNMWKLYRVKRKIFDTVDVTLRDEQLYQTMSNYFSPGSKYKKI